MFIEREIWVMPILYSFCITVLLHIAKEEWTTRYQYQPQRSKCDSCMLQVLKEIYQEYLPDLEG